MSSKKTNNVVRRGMKLSFFSANLEEEDEGRWEALAGTEGVEFKLRSLHCDDVQDFIANETARMQKQKDSLELDGKTQSQIFRRAVGEKLLVGWQGLLNDEDEPEIFTRERAIEIMTERRWRRLSDAISLLVVNRSKVLFEDRADLGKGFESSSDSVSGSGGSLKAIAS